MATLSDERKLRGAALLVFINGILTLVTFLIMGIAVGGDLPAPIEKADPPGFTNSMLWFELAADLSEVKQVLGEGGTPEGDEMREKMDLANKLDYPFMVAYSLLNASIFILMYVLARSRKLPLFSSNLFAHLGLALALAMLVGDIMENIQLLALTKASDPMTLSPKLVYWLNIWTRVKWVSILLAAGLLGLCYSAYFGFKPGILLGLIYTICAILGLLAVSIHDARRLLEFSMALLIVGWVSSFAHGTFHFFRRGAKAS